MTEPTLDHLTLLREAVWEWSDCEYGAPAIDPKRPFGSSNVEDSLAELLPDLPPQEREATFQELADVIRYMAQHWPGPSRPDAEVELDALSNIVEELSAMPPEAHGRTLRYLADRFGGSK